MFDHYVRQHSFVEIGHEIISTAIISLPLIQEGQLSVAVIDFPHMQKLIYAENILSVVKQLLLLNVQTILQQFSNKTISFSVCAGRPHLKQRNLTIFKLIVLPIIRSIAEVSVRPELQDLTGDFAHAQLR